VVANDVRRQQQEQMTDHDYKKAAKKLRREKEVDIVKGIEEREDKAAIDILEGLRTNHLSDHHDLKPNMYAVADLFRGADLTAVQYWTAVQSLGLIAAGKTYEELRKLAVAVKSEAWRLKSSAKPTTAAAADAAAVASPAAALTSPIVILLDTSSSSRRNRSRRLRNKKKRDAGKRASLYIFVVLFSLSSGFLSFHVPRLARIYLYNKPS
jgi:hypothetical protein